MKISASEITKTAVLLSILLIFQYVGSMTGNRPIIAIFVNFTLAFSACYLRLPLTVIIALSSPILAFILGIAPQPFLVPSIMLANVVFVMMISLTYLKIIFFRISGCILGALFKFIVLWISVSYILPYFISLPPEKMAGIIALFSLPQFFTALIGSFMALFVVRIVPHKSNNA